MADDLSSDKEASERAMPAAWMRERLFRQSQAADELRTVSKKATPTLQQVSAYCFLLIDFYLSQTSCTCAMLSLLI